MVLIFLINDKLLEIIRKNRKIKTGDRPILLPIRSFFKFMNSKSSSDMLDNSMAADEGLATWL